ncbi:serine hydrolase domain-containing protein [Moheibacter sediminis]|uniref:CubicO group peptidase, beta-lactamase class C family n=1 Tax=Moheibacter sediminis TaxID=1434700 RepID=A0A1W2C8U0_9FLAO|nr:serine hydrolase [Moheibacter sediminis]SMC81593.1 CubicO group peptidase, beta-lactamase class C family [Moheibacter sediminis]
MSRFRKIILRTLQVILGILLLLVAILYITGNDYIIRGVQLTYMKGHNTANIDDYKDFDNNLILADKPQRWEQHELFNKIPLTDTLQNELEKFKSVGFFVAKDGKVLLEYYWDGYSNESHTNSFSMAKSVITMLLGKAIEQGYIKSLDQPITDFLPEFKDDEFGKLCTVGDLSAMTSGYDWLEDYYLPLNPSAKAYYGDQIEKQMLSRKFIQKPGGDFNYLSGDTQLLAIVLQRATKRSASQYLQEEFWQPMGMEEDAYWSKDRKDGMEKAFCCLNSNVRDFGKLGQLLLQNGKWNGKQILDSAFVQKMITPNYKAFKKGQPASYGYSIWTDYEHQPNFYGLMGHLGQRVIVVPSENLIIVRLGHEKDKRNLNKGFLDTDTYYFVDEVMKMLKNHNLLNSQNAKKDSLP